MTPGPGELLDGRSTLKDRIRQRRPSSLPLPVYLSGWLQALIQLAVFIVSFKLLRGESNPALVVFYSIAFGWAWFALLMVGHDAMHRAFAPWRWVNGLVAFLTLDCLLFSRAAWLHGHHVIHHARPHSREDQMYLRGNSFVGDMWNLLRMVLSYLGSDVTRLFAHPTWHEWLGMGVRIGLLAMLLPFALFPAVFFLLLFGNYLGLLSHSLPVQRRSDDLVIRQLRSTWDLYPESFIASLLTGGLNAHATHHVYPALPRGAQARGAGVLREEAGDEYRCIRSLTGLWTLFRLRHCSTSEIATIEAIGAGKVLVEASRGEADVAIPVAEQNAKLLTPALGIARGAYSGGADASTRARVDKRVRERRLEQRSVAFPERRRGDRRGGGASAAAA